MLFLLLIAAAGVLAMTGNVGEAAAVLGLGGGLSELEAQVFTGILPSRARPYAGVLLQVANEQGIAPALLFAIVDRETLWGTAAQLDLPGPAGTGDFTKRNARKWGSELPPDGRGWGRGLAQIDYGSFADWLAENDWTDPYVNLTKGAQIWKAKRSYLDSHTDLDGPELDRAAVAAYNAGEGRVADAVKAGEDPDTKTSGGEYSADARAHRDRLVRPGGGHRLHRAAHLLQNALRDVA
jgi:soluble lytic murein transglycosylase-like protein